MWSHFVACILASLALQPQPVAVLVPGVEVQGSLGAAASPGSTESSAASTFHVALAAGEAVAVTVSQPGVDLKVTLLDPAGQELTRVDLHKPQQGDERLHAIAASEGTHVLRVDASTSSASAGARFIVRLTSTRPATDEDRARSDAARAYAQADVDAGRGTNDARRSALASFQRARLLWQSTGDRFEEATALNRVGLVHMQLANLDDALAAHDEALRIRRAIGDRYGEGVSLNNLAAIYMRRGDYPRAQALYEDALNARREVDDRDGEGWSLIGMAVAQAIRTGGWQPALAHVQRALALFTAVKDGRGEAEALYYLGYAHKQLNGFDEAMAHFERALALRRAQRDLAGQASILNQVVAVHLQLGDPQRALELIDDILLLRRQAGDRRGEAYTLQTAGMTAIDLGDLDAARARLTEALQLFETIGDREGQTSALTHMARVHAAAGDPIRALDVATRARRVLEGDRTLMTTTLLSIVGDAQLALGRHADAEDSFTQALTESRRLGETISAAKALTGLGRNARARGDLAASRDRLLEALTLIESVRAGVAQPEQRASFLGLTQSAYESAIDTLMDLHEQDPSGRYAADALAVSERRRARTLIEMLATARANLDGDGDANRPAIDLRSARDAEAVRPAAGMRGARDTDVVNSAPSTLDLTGIQRLLDPDTMLLEYALGERRSYVWAITPDTMTVRTLPDRARIEAAAREVHRLVSESARRSLRAPMQRATADLSAMVLTPIADVITTAPAGTRDTTRLAIVADGALQYVPFAALPDPIRSPAASAKMDTEPLILRREIVMLPSASTLELFRQPMPDRAAAREASDAERTHTPRVVAVLADPVVDVDDPRFTASATPRAALPGGGAASDRPIGADRSRDLARAAEDVGLTRFERLPYTRDEAAVIASKAGRDASLTALGFDATRELALSPALADVRILHFATHTTLDARHPERSGIVLTLVDRERRPIDGILRLRDIFTLRLSTDLVVLSACQTALGKDIRGEGLIGLTRGFMHAGASQVVASLWNIHDRATAQLMARFYAGLLDRGLTSAAALREAQMSMWKTPQWRVPAYWAGFVAQGDWRTRGAGQTRARRLSTKLTQAVVNVPRARETGPTRFRGPKAELTPTVVDAAKVRAGATVRAVVKVRLPEGIHVQSDKPREAAFIPTVLTIDAPAGVRVDKIVYPPASDLTQVGLDQPLAVFGREFTITAHLTLASTVATGDLVVPAHLRYQACDAQVCYPPAKVDTRWTLHVR